MRLFFSKFQIIPPIILSNYQRQKGSFKENVQKENKKLDRRRNRNQQQKKIQKLLSMLQKELPRQRHVVIFFQD